MARIESDGQVVRRLIQRPVGQKGHLESCGRKARRPTAPIKISRPPRPTIHGQRSGAPVKARPVPVDPPVVESPLPDAPLDEAVETMAAGTEVVVEVELCPLVVVVVVLDVVVVVVVAVPVEVNTTATL
jgi:hypothetical protein